MVQIAFALDQTGIIDVLQHVPAHLLALLGLHFVILQFLFGLWFGSSLVIFLIRVRNWFLFLFSDSIILVMINGVRSRHFGIIITAYCTSLHLVFHGFSIDYVFVFIIKKRGNAFDHFVFVLVTFDVRSVDALEDAQLLDNVVRGAFVWQLQNPID